MSPMKFDISADQPRLLKPRARGQRVENRLPLGPLFDSALENKFDPDVTPFRRQRYLPGPVYPILFTSQELV